MFVVVLVSACTRTEVEPVRDEGRSYAVVPSLDVAIAELRGKRVGSDKVGVSARESTFFLAGRALFPSLTLAYLERLAHADDPTLRAFGLWGLALANRPESLLRHVCDRELLVVCAGGWICAYQTLGELAQRFATEPRYLGNPTRAFVSPDPLVPKAVLARRVAACAK